MERYEESFNEKALADFRDMIVLVRGVPVIFERKGHLKYPPKAFTEHGALMAATILNSPQAVKMSVFVMRAFVAMHSLLMTQQDLAKKLAALERALTERLDTREHAISDIIQQIM